VAGHRVYTLIAASDTLNGDELSDLEAKFDVLQKQMDAIEAQLDTL
jgi:hypothetical protein